jgi:hypothetical protein
MVHCKNAGGGPSDGDESPPRVIEVARGKLKVPSLVLAN